MGAGAAERRESEGERERDVGRRGESGRRCGGGWRAVRTRRPDKRSEEGVGRKEEEAMLPSELEQVSVSGSPLRLPWVGNSGGGGSRGAVRVAVALICFFARRSPALCSPRFGGGALPGPTRLPANSCAFPGLVFHSRLVLGLV